MPRYFVLKYQLRRVVVNEAHQPFRRASCCKREPVELRGSSARAIGDVARCNRYGRGFEPSEATALGVRIDVAAGECEDFEALVAVHIRRNRMLQPLTLQRGQLDVSLLQHRVRAQLLQ